MVKKKTEKNSANMGNRVIVVDDVEYAVHKEVDKKEKQLIESNGEVYKPHFFVKSKGKTVYSSKKSKLSVSQWLKTIK